MSIWVWLLISVLICGIGEYTCKQWSITPTWKMMTVSLIAYVVGSAAWFPVVRQSQHIIIAWMLWAVLSAFTTVLVGLHFGEVLTVPQWIGIVLGVISIILIAV